MDSPHLSKLKFVAGTQCHLRLWWAVHEPDAEELEPDAFLLALFARGTRVGERAREEFPGGVRIEFDPRRKREAVEATRQAMAGDAPAIIEACFEEDGVFVAVDILERTQAGWNLIEVKSAGEVKPEHLPDVTVQAHVLRAAGLQVERVELMYVNKENRFPSTSDLFTRADLTDEVTNWVSYIPAEIDAQLRCLAGPRPDVQPGEHCSKPNPCPFLSRCHAGGPEHPVKDLHNPSKRLKEQLSSRGIERMVDIPDDIVLMPKHQRQVDAVRSGEIVVAPGLAEVLATWEEPIAYLDFESMAPFPPCWDGCGPSTAVPIQWSVHRRTSDGVLEHEAWLAEGSADPRASQAQALIQATKDSKTVLVYSGYESRMIGELTRALPELADELADLKSRFVDLLPVVRDHVYHPDFHGSFSIKVALPALVPDLGYDDLAVADGYSAALLLENMLLHPGSLGDTDPALLRSDLLAYCERDTLAMVRLHERLIELAEHGGGEAAD